MPKMTDQQRAEQAADLFLKLNKDHGHEAWTRAWQKAAGRLGYSISYEAELAAYRADLTAIGHERLMRMPAPWRRRAQAWNRELEAAAAAGTPISAKPPEPGYRRFAVDRVP